ncbi:MAG TPA: hypothetical protein VGP52_01770 [Stellaceae bacterium]|jgi:hypothetical protein|nr:hypothetical protein [Stellaceae bacterium]
MPNRVQYADAIEPLVQFIEETPPAEILDRTLEKLRAGVPTQTMLTASALAVARSTDLPPGHHGGPLHPLVGLHAVSQLVGRLEGEERFVPVLQHVALSNKHIHHPAMGPYALLEFAPEDAGGIEATKAAFLMACSRGESNKADHLFLWLWEHAPRIEAFDLLLSVAIPKNIIDDHYFAFPAFTWRALETESVEPEYFPVLMRQAVRYVARLPSAPMLPEIEALIGEHELISRVTRQQSGEDETAAIGGLGEAIGRVDVFTEIPALMAKALGDGLSLEGAGEALSIGAAGLFLRSLGGNPMDVHLHTSANIRRYLLKMDGVSLRNKLLLLLTWHSGPEIRSTASRLQPAPQPDWAAVAALPPRSQEQLLDAITHSVYNQPPTDWSQVSNLGLMKAVPEVRATVNLAQQYVNSGYDAQALIARLAEIVCHDNFTEMHAFKHHQAIIEEFYATHEPWRWMHLVCGVQAAAISFGKNMAVYEEALELLHAA